MHSWTVASRVTFTDVEVLSKNMLRITGGSDFKTWKGGENVMFIYILFIYLLDTHGHLTKYIKKQ